MKTKSPFFWPFAITASAAVVGFAGLNVGMALFPESDLLGGFGLVFGPLWWLGATGLVLVAIAWVVAQVKGRDVPGGDR